MRKLVFITGAISLSLYGMYLFFKALHLYGSGYILLFATVLFSFVSVPCAAIYYYKRGK